MRKKSEPDAYWKLIEPIWKKISLYDGPEIFLRQYAKVNPGVGELFAINWCQSEVCNGGFHQFFTNSTGVLAPEALAGFRSVGLRDCGELLKEAMAFFGEPYPREREIRIERLRKRKGKSRKDWDPFNKLDDQFYKCLNDENDQKYHSRFCRLANAYALGLAT